MGEPIGPGATITCVRLLLQLLHGSFKKSGALPRVPTSYPLKYIQSFWKIANSYPSKIIPNKTMLHRENGGKTHGMVPLIINPIYTLYHVAIDWVYPIYPLLKGSNKGTCLPHAGENRHFTNAYPSKSKSLNTHQLQLTESFGLVLGVPQRIDGWRRNIWSHRDEPPQKTRPYFPWNTGCLIGILIMVYYNPHITG